MSRFPSGEVADNSSFAATDTAEIAPHRHHRAGLTSNADVLEVIAAHACGTVTDACALRGACKGYRRAVDTTVRRLVYEDQPALRNLRDATLRVHSGSEHLDAVRIAFTCDWFASIARLVVVAFALDGAKDDLRESGVCGPRPVACSDAAVEDDTSHTSVDVHSCWAEAFVPPPPPPPGTGVSAASPALTLQRNLTSVFVCEEMLTDELCSELERPGGGWPRVTQIKIAPDYYSFGNGSTPDADLCAERQRRLAQVLVSVGPQLMRLSISAVHTEEEVAAAVGGCGKLQSFHLKCSESCSDDETPTYAAMCDALIASGAPLVSVAAPFAAKDALRMLEAVPTITEAALPSLRIGDLPSHIAGRMRAFNGEGPSIHLPCLERVKLSTAQSWREPAPNATHVFAFTGPLRVADVAATFPVLEHFGVRGVAPDVDVNAIRLPSTLRSLEFKDLSSFDKTATQLVAHLAHTHRPGLAELIVSDHVDITPLTAFASTLTSLTLGVSGSPSLGPSAIAALESTMEQLVNLRVVNVRSLTSAQCFLGGNHRRLRRLTVKDVGVPLTTLAAACPRLMELAVHKAASVVVTPDSADAWTQGLGPPGGFVFWWRVSFCP